MIDLRRAGRRYGEHWAVRDIDLTIQRGEMFGIVGTDGAGKTTLLQLCAALLDPTEGRCTVLGYDTVRESKAVTSRIGYMSQGFTLYDRLSVAENLRFSAGLRNLSAREFTDRSQRLLDMAGLREFESRLAGKLSGGMRKKLALCLNLIHEPDLLILDEPGLGVDPLSRRELWRMLEAFRERGVTVVVASSYMDEAERCDRVLLLQMGHPIGTDRPEALRLAVAGRVYEIVTNDPTRVAGELSSRYSAQGIQVLPDRVRFQHGSTEAPGPDPRLDSMGARTADATLEDLFVFHSNEHAEPFAAWGELPNVETPGAIEADDVSVTFGGFRAVDHVSLVAEPGTLLALLGPNGAGKTTLIRALCGLQPISSGEARIAGTPVTTAATSVRQRIGYMSQRFSLYPDLTVGENMEFFAAAYGLTGSASESAIFRARALTGLEPVAPGTRVEAMSGATRQRLALACSVLHEPAVLFLDEPTSGVDPLSRFRFWQLIRALASAGMVIVVTTHYLEEARYCDRIGLMDRGRLIALGSLPELRRQTASGDTDSVETVFLNALRRPGVAPS
ncbi:MAG: multidrug ABC transporter ATP-binding protein [Gammaproteobacteria bacterium]|nr:multidrug ABC transporter ATP-binding protein [Gammaproteobacteria bacterium]|tara:strand:- start:7310 stop:8992 length:1683 start_codon:yes stop_codon:yes gene_type:complete